MEHWILDNFKKDPWAGQAMVDTAEAVAAEAGIERGELDELTLLRYEQYEAALADDRAFQRRWMVPVTVPRRGRDPLVIDSDEGIYATTAEGLAKLAPQSPDGVRHIRHADPSRRRHRGHGRRADRDRRVSSAAAGVSLGSSALGSPGSRRRACRRRPCPRRWSALADAGLTIEQVDAVKSHNPFAVNDVWFARQTGFPIDRTQCVRLQPHLRAPARHRPELARSSS